ncbi:MAG: hypothetical protein AAGE92_06860 [Cyanobacteria bacterium P01_G01_bin.4]
MTILKPPVLMASEPNSALVTFGLIITIVAVLLVVVSLTAFAIATRDKRQSNRTRQESAPERASGDLGGEGAPT